MPKPKLNFLDTPPADMQLVDEPLSGVKILKPFVFEDERGNFVKPFHEGQLAEHSLSLSLKEEFFSTSDTNVLRGMHFQLPPHQHNKLVYCLTGKVWDVVVDLRKDSLTFGKAVGFELSAKNRHCVFIPIGFGHGFLSQEPNSCLIYKTDAVHAPEADAGIAWDSLGYHWPLGAEAPIMSGRDLTHPKFADFESPF